MRTLITADLHLSEQPVNSYRIDFLKNQLPKLLIKHKIERLIIAGDLTELKDHHSGWLTHHMVEGMAKLADMVEVVVVEGNHDFIDIEYPFFRFMELLGTEYGIRWIRQPTELNGLLLLPHTSDYKHDWLNTPIQYSRSKLIVTHNTFDGASSERGSKLKGIPLSVLPNLPIISGDVHQPQRLKNLQYVGPPYTVYFGDDYDPRVFIIDDRWQISSHPTNTPRKRQLDLDYPIKASEFAGCQPGDIIKLRIAITTKEAPEWSRIRDDARSLAAKKGFHIFAVQPLVRNIKWHSASKAATGQLKSDEQLIKEYCARRNADKTTMARGIRFVSSAEATATARTATDKAK